MTKARFDFLKRETHEGAFGWDYGEVSETRVPVVKDAEFVGDERVFFVFKFPYDMFGDNAQFIPYDAVVDISLPVGTYPLWADRWFIQAMKTANPQYIVELNKHGVINNYTNPARLVTKFRTSFRNKTVFSILQETKNGVHPTRVYPVWGQHHAAMVFYSHKDNVSMSPESLLSLLPDIGKLFKKYKLIAWIDRLKYFVNLRAIYGTCAS